jgi:hypothetical protein
MSSAARGVRNPPSERTCIHEERAAPKRERKEKEAGQTARTVLREQRVRGKRNTKYEATAAMRVRIQHEYNYKETETQEKRQNDAQEQRTREGWEGARKNRTRRLDENQRENEKR